MAVLGTENEEEAKKKADVKREQKKLREGKGKKEEVVVSAAPDVETAQSSEGAAEEKKSIKRVRVRSKSYKALKSQVDITKQYPLSEGLKLLREVSKTKFDPSVELHISLKEKGFNKEVELPHTTGKTKRIAIANEETIAKIQKNQIDFDVLLASADQMGSLVKFAKVLGPKGLMPNPKNGTVVTNPEKTAKDMAGRVSVNLKTEKDAPLLHTTVGKLSMTDKVLEENITAITNSVAGKSVKIILKSSMSPAIKLQGN